MRADPHSLESRPVTRQTWETVLASLHWGEEMVFDQERDTFAQAPQWLRSAWHLIQQPAHLRLGVREFQRLCGRCPEPVSREFKKQTGETIVGSITRLRMEHAAALLAGSTEQIVDIAHDCGFDSLSHFYACFRKAYRVSPRDYRKKAQKQMYL